MLNRRSFAMSAAVMYFLSSDSFASDPILPVYAQAIQLARDTQQTDKSQLSEPIGSWLAKNGSIYTRYSESPGILIGFDLGLGKLDEQERIYAIKPIFYTNRGEIKGEEVGIFTNREAPEKNHDPGKVKVVIKTSVERTITIKAKSGYAVSGVRIKPGVSIDGLKVSFAKVDGVKLDLADTYSSDWICTLPMGDEMTLTSEGRIIIGITGSCQEVYNLQVWVISIGFRCAPLQKSTAQTIPSKSKNSSTSSTVTKTNSEQSSVTNVVDPVTLNKQRKLETKQDSLLTIGKKDEYSQKSEIAQPTRNNDKQRVSVQQNEPQNEHHWTIPLLIGLATTSLLAFIMVVLQRKR